MAIPTLSEIVDSLLENADFEEEGSVTKAKAYAIAAKRYLSIAPQSQSDQGSSMSMDTAQIRAMLTRAQLFIESNKSDGSRVRFFGFSSDYRGA